MCGCSPIPSASGEKAVDIYRMFELGERLVYFFDRAAYHTAVGYAGKNTGRPRR